MNCVHWAEAIALHAGGDSVEPGLLEHLEACPGCRSELEATQASLRSLATVPLPAEPALANVRCGMWQQAVALLAGGDDIDPAAAAHIESCKACRAEVAAIGASIVGLRSIPQPVPRRTANRLPAYWRWPAAAAAALLIGWLAWPQPALVLELALTIPPPPGVVDVAVPGRRVARPRVQHVMAKQQPVATPAATIKLITDDPDVVILLVGDGE